MDENRSTKHRLLRAACAIFAEKGFRDATVAEICEAAGANIAAVNYHFGDKSNLYYECFRHLFDVAQKAYPQPDPQTAMPEEWLRSFIRSRIGNILDAGEAGLLPKLMHQEMGQPTELHPHLLKKLILPRHQVVADMVRAFLGNTAGNAELNTAVINFTSLYVFINVDKQRGQRSPLCRTEQPGGAMDREVMAAQVEHFAMGGLEATREFLKTGKAGL